MSWESAFTFVSECLGIFRFPPAINIWPDWMVSPLQPPHYRITSAAYINDRELWKGWSSEETISKNPRDPEKNETGGKIFKKSFKINILVTLFAIYGPPPKQLYVCLCLHSIRVRWMRCKLLHENSIRIRKIPIFHFSIPRTNESQKFHPITH